MNVLTVRTPGLGDSTYLLTHGGLGVLVDPQRDVERFLRLATEHDVQLRWVLETHLHNDYVSGGREAAARTGAELVLPAGAAVPFEHVSAFHGEDLVESELAIRPLHTPGHTPEHLSYLVLCDGEPTAVFSGGSLLVGSAGRCDLLGTDKAHGLTLAQYRSVQRLAALPGHVSLYPTHGQGSFCTASAAGRATSTIGDEKRSNPVLTYRDAEAFVTGQLAGLLPYPSYYAHMGAVNYRGPEPMPDLSVAQLSVEKLAALDDDVRIVDMRPRRAAADGHIPGALTVELSQQFGIWVGWLLPFGTPLALVADPEQDVDEALVQLARIGLDDVRGVFTQMAAWKAAKHPVTAYRLEPLDTFTQLINTPGAQVLDVRDPQEHAAVPLPGAIHRYVPNLVDDIPTDLDQTRPVLIGCASGYRAAIAASLVQPAGYEPIVLDESGIPDLVRTGRRGAP